MFGLKKKKVLISEEEVLDKLEIQNFSEMTKDKVQEFTKQIPNMQVEVVKKAFEQFPNFVQMAGEVVGCYKEMIINTAKQNDIETKSIIDDCDAISSALKSMLEKEKLKFRKKKFIINQITEILKFKSEEIAKSRKERLKLLKVSARVLISVVGILGIAFFGRNPNE